jgi:DNA primase large subunit
VDARYVGGQKVRIVALIDSQGRPNPQIQRFVNEVGTVVRSYCVSGDEFPDLNKMFVYPDVYCYDIRLDERDVVLFGVPEVALELCIF